MFKTTNQYVGSRLNGKFLYRDWLQSPILPLGQWMESMFSKSRTLIPSANSSVVTVALKTSLVVFQIT
jgi:hypothetical protein